MEYYRNQHGILLNGDCIEELSKVENKSQQLICIDPPYNIGKDYWDIIPDYYNWLGGIIEVLETKFNKMAEYFNFYTFDNSWKLKRKRDELKINQLTISSEIKSKTGGITGWYSNIETGRNNPTHDTIKPITKHLGITFDELVPKFRNQKTDHSVMNYDIEEKFGHITPKPVKLLENILLHLTDKDDSVLDCFGGSGSLAVAAQNLNRKWILIEKEEEYCKITKKRLEKTQLKLDF